MFSFVYDLVQLIAVLLLLPYRIYGRVVHKDPSLSAHLGFVLPEERRAVKGPVFLIYAVSVGETKAAASLLPRIRKIYPDSTVYAISRTVTGMEEAKRSLPFADGYFFLPFDFSFLSKRFVDRLKPDVVLVLEGDLWYHFLKSSKERGALLCLVSGKISEGSFRRFSTVPFVAKRLFSLFSLICAQTGTFARRFIGLGAGPSAVHVTGNIKLENSPDLFTKEQAALLRDRLGIQQQDFVVVFGSTHAPEEEKIVELFKSLSTQNPKLKFLLVPRHPGRFGEVERILSRSGISFSMFSDEKRKKGGERIVCIDTLGLLFDLYQIADLAVVCGSFFPSLKGHNIFEPVAAGAPVLFGPYMSDQKNLVEIVLGEHAGLQVAPEELAGVIQSFSEDPSSLLTLRENGRRLLSTTRKSGSSTWERLRYAVDSKLSRPI